MTRPRHQGPDASQVDQIGSMRAQKAVRRQQQLQPVQRRPQNQCAVVPVEEAGAVTRFDELDRLGRQCHVMVGGRDEDPGDWRGSAEHGAGPRPRGRGLQAPGRGACLKMLQARPDAADGPLDARRRQRLHEIVGGVQVERVRGIVGISGGKHHRRPRNGARPRASARPGDLDPINIRHTDVETQQVGPGLVERRQDLTAGRALTDGVNVARLEQIAQMPPCAGLVVGDQGAQG